MQIDEKLLNILERIPYFIDELNNKQIEREELVPLLIIALFSKKHIFLLGEPGVSKTGILEIFASYITNAKIFDICMKDDTVYEELFGDRYRDENNKMVSDYEDTLVDSHIAIIDETWKGDSKVMNSLLSATSNYRVVHIKGKGKMKIPLVSLFGASNELPEDPSLNALSDRFVFKYVVNRIRDDNNWLKFINREYNTNKECDVFFTLEDLEIVNNASKNVIIEPFIINKLLNIKKDILKLQVNSSDRKYDSLIDILKVSALLDNRTKVEIQDLFLLLHVLWEKEEEILIVRKVVFDHIFNTAEYILSIYENNKRKLQQETSILENELNDLIKFRIHFEKEIEFNKYIDYTIKLKENLEKTLLNFNSIINHYYANNELEQVIFNNKLLGNYKSNIYINSEIDSEIEYSEDIVIVDIYKIKLDILEVEKNIQNLNKWLENYSLYYQYNAKSIEYNK